VTDGLSEYIKKSLSSGASEATIRDNLLQKGWSKDQVDKAFENSTNNSNKSRISLKKASLNLLKGLLFAYVVYWVYAFVVIGPYALGGAPKLSASATFFMTAPLFFLSVVAFLTPNILYLIRKLNPIIVLTVSLLISIILSLTFYFILSSVLSVQQS